MEVFSGMGVDYMLAYNCEPKAQFSPAGLLQRVKAKERAVLIREFYAQEKAPRPADEMGFEMIYRNAKGEQETTLIKISELDSLAAELETWESHCLHCPANHAKKPFGCIGSINYPISGRAEVWMLERLPSIDEPMPFLLLMQGPQMGNTGARAEDLRDGHPGVFFESSSPLKREYPEGDVTGEQLFELLFLLGNIQPKRAVMILLFLGAIRRDFEANILMSLTPAGEESGTQFPYLLKSEAMDDQTLRDLKAFCWALYRAWLLNLDVHLDV